MKVPSDMIDKDTRERIIALVHQEVVPAIGCTEPMCVALCTARATERLGCRPEHIEARLSANIIKNAMGVGIPGTGMIGLPIAIALGALIGKSQYQLEVLKDLSPEALEEGKQFIAEDRIRVMLKEGISEKLYAEVTCRAAGKEATAVISGSHTRFIEAPEVPVAPEPEPEPPEVAIKIIIIINKRIKAPVTPAIIKYFFELGLTYFSSAIIPSLFKSP